jgi:hypothetical protein
MKKVCFALVLIAISPILSVLAQDDDLDILPVAGWVNYEGGLIEQAFEPCYKGTISATVTSETVVGSSLTFLDDDTGAVLASGSTSLDYRITAVRDSCTLQFEADTACLVRFDVQYTPEISQQMAELPTAEALAYGDQVSGELETVPEYKYYSFEGQEGDVVKIKVSGDGWLDPIVSLYQGAGSPIATNNDFSSETATAILTEILPSSGTYYIQVSGAPAGEFELEIEQAPVIGGYWGPEEVSLLPNVDAKVYAVECTEGMYVTITAQRRSWAGPAIRIENGAGVVGLTTGNIESVVYHARQDEILMLLVTNQREHTFEVGAYDWIFEVSTFEMPDADDLPESLPPG